MALPAVAGNTIFASDLYQLCRPSGGQETGKYYLGGWAGAINDLVSLYMPSLSRNATPTGVVIDTADQAASNLQTVAANNLTANGFQISAGASGAATNCHAAGNYTISF